MINRALISVSDKTGLTEFARRLNKLGIEIISTGGTASALKKAGIPVIEVSEVTGSPEILDGRVKTLHPKIHGGILAIRGNPRHQKELEASGTRPIDMVVVNLYPFEATIAKPDCKFEDAIENIDIGGPSMLRAAAKNWQDVAVVVDPLDYERIIGELEAKGAISKEIHFELAQKAFALSACYEAAICNYLSSASGVAGFSLRESGEIKNQPFPQHLALTFEKVHDLRYGENPHQRAAFYVPPLCKGRLGGVEDITQLHGKELSYNNIMDADAAIAVVGEFSSTAAAIIKHANPCGVAISKKSLADAFVKARDCDPVSAFGGIVALNRAVDIDTARAIGDTFFEVIIAPGFDEGGLEILKAKKNLRLLEMIVGAALSGRPFGEGTEPLPYDIRRVSLGLLIQEPDTAATDVRACKVATKRSPTEDEYPALDFAWRVVKHVKSNAIVITSEDRTLGIGAGQTSRVDSVKIAIIKMNEIPPQTLPLTKGGKGGICKLRVLASDAFFPFRDGVDLAAEAGVTAVIQPGGSVRDEEVVKSADEHGIAMIFTGIRHFKH